MNKTRVLSATISEFRAKLARYLRMVKAGEMVEIKERDIPVAIVTAPKKGTRLGIVPPRKDPLRLAKYKFSVRPKKGVDIVQILLEERNRR